jgi:hypothetical protein
MATGSKMDTDTAAAPADAAVMAAIEATHESPPIPYREYGSESYLGQHEGGRGRGGYPTHAVSIGITTPLYGWIRILNISFSY